MSARLVDLGVDEVILNVIVYMLSTPSDGDETAVKLLSLIKGFIALILLRQVSNQA